MTGADHHHRRSARRALALGVAASAGVASACAGKPSPAADSGATLAAPATATAGRTVFTDTALFRRICAEADSGLTPATARRCTPRDQSLDIIPRDAPRVP